MKNKIVILVQNDLKIKIAKIKNKLMIPCFQNISQYEFIREKKKKRNILNDICQNKKEVQMF